MIMTNNEVAARAGTLPGTVDLLPEGGDYNVICSTDQASLPELMKEQGTQYVMVGAVLPVRSGSELCRMLGSKEQRMPYPVMLLRKREDETKTPPETPLSQAAARALTAGPLHHALRELMDDQASDQTIQDDQIEIHPGRHEVKVSGELVDMTATEFKLLRLLVERKGWVHSRDQIIETLRGKDYACTRRSVDVLVVSLRRKLGPLGKRIQTVRGVGYRYRSE